MAKKKLQPSDEVPQLTISGQLTDDDRRAIYTYMLKAREFDAAFLRLYRQGRAFGGVYSQLGNEAVSVGSAYALRPEDAIFPMHRNIGAHFVRGQEIDSLMRNHLAREGSMMRGTDGTGHYADPSKKLYGNVSHLAAMIPVAAGFAMAAKMRGESCVALTYIGDGGSQVGDFHEGLNFAAVQHIPLVLIIENNQFAYSSPNSVEFACESLADRAKGYGIYGESIDGTDVELVFDTCKRAVERARTEGIPSIIETKTMRMRGHAEHDDFSYVPKEMLESWQKKDPVERYEKLLLERGVFSSADIATMRQELSNAMNTTIDTVVNLPFPDASEGRKLVFVD